ncbi:hypothetical protein BGW39_008594 [Mortierella sp. 14UC]|nr:hypothetical protein BGW39_008594 [Mortierella sp. 14UC]
MASKQNPSLKRTFSVMEESGPKVWLSPTVTEDYTNLIHHEGFITMRENRFTDTGDNKFWKPSNIMIERGSNYELNKAGDLKKISVVNHRTSIAVPNTTDLSWTFFNWVNCLYEKDSSVNQTRSDATKKTKAATSPPTTTTDPFETALPEDFTPAVNRVLVAKAIFKDIGRGYYEVDFYYVVEFIRSDQASSSSSAGQASSSSSAGQASSSSAGQALSSSSASQVSSSTTLSSEVPPQPAKVKWEVTKNRYRLYITSADQKYFPIVARQGHSGTFKVLDVKLGLFDDSVESFLTASRCKISDPSASSNNNAEEPALSMAIIKQPDFLEILNCAVKEGVLEEQKCLYKKIGFHPDLSQEPVPPSSKRPCIGASPAKNPATHGDDDGSPGSSLPLRFWAALQDGNDNSSGSQFCCPHKGCKFVSDTCTAIDQHFTDSHPLPELQIHCPNADCRYVADTEKAMDQHLQDTHLHVSDRGRQCYICGETFTRKDSLGRHDKAHDAKKHVTCNICRKPFTRGYNMESHKCKGKNKEE